MAAIITTTTTALPTVGLPARIRDAHRPTLPTPRARLRAVVAAFRAESARPRSVAPAMREAMGPGLQVQFDAAGVFESAR